MKRAKQALALLLSLALLPGLCGLAEEPVEAMAIEELVEEPNGELLEDLPEEPLEGLDAGEEQVEEGPSNGELAEEGQVQEEPAEEEQAQEPVEGELSLEAKQFDVEDLGAYKWFGTDEERQSVTNLSIPDGYTSIATDGCINMGNLTSVSIPSTVTLIGSTAFAGCWSLPSVSIPDSVISIGDGAFEGCQKLVSAHIGSNVESLGDEVFSGCLQLKTVNIPGKVSSIGYSAFNGDDALQSIEIPSSVKSIGESAFYWCRGMSSITFSEGLESIGDDAFGVCDSLTTIDLPSTLKTIGNRAFNGCNGIKTIVIPGSVTSIGNYAFYGTELSSVKFNEGLQSIGDYAFNSCRNLTSIEIPEGVTTIGEGAFDACTSLEEMYLPKSLTNIGLRGISGLGSGYTAYVYKDSYAEQYCKDHKINYKYRDPVATVSLSSDSISLSQKETLTLKPKTEGLKKKESYTFSTSDASVAAVSKAGGKITAKNPGTATITATGKTSGASASCTVTVSAAPASLTIPEPPTELKLNEEFQLAASIEPAGSLQEFTWKSSKPKIASVDKATGLVKALKEGKTTITATAKHKNLKGKSVTAKFTLTVVDPKRPTAIKIDPEMQTELVMTDGQQVTMQLKYTLEPADTAETEVTWSIPKKAHKSYASVTKEGQLTAKKAGKVQLKVTAKKKNAAGKTLSATVNITITDPTIPTSVTITDADGAPIAQTIQIKKGEKLTLHALCAPETAANAELEWSSSNKKVLQVNKSTGEITAVKSGKAQITAKAKKGGQKVSITVQVIQ